MRAYIFAFKCILNNSLWRARIAIGIGLWFGGGRSNGRECGKLLFAIFVVWGKRNSAFS